MPWVFLAIGALIATAMPVVKVVAQPPGTPPPGDLWQSPAPWSGDLEGIRPNAFLFKDESGTPVVMPRMSFEEIDRLRKLDLGMRDQQELFLIQAMEIEGKIDRGFASWDASIRLLIQPATRRQTTDRPIVVPIRLSGLHLASTPVVTIVDGPMTASSAKTVIDADVNSGKVLSNAFIQFVSPESVPADTPPNGASDLVKRLALSNQTLGGSSLPTTRGRGYEVVLPSSIREKNSPQWINVRIRLSGRVSSEVVEPLWWTLLDLPRTTCHASVTSTIDSDGMKVIGDGAEIVREIAGTSKDEAGHYEIRSGGGLLAIVLQSEGKDTSKQLSLIEAESTTRIQWPSPDDAPEMETLLLVENLNGPLTRFEAKLPDGCVLTGAPELIDADDLLGNSELLDDAWSVQVEQAVPPKENAPSRQQRVIVTRRSENVSANEPEGSSEPTTLSSAIGLRLPYRRTVSSTSSSRPWLVEVPEISGAMTQRGQVEIVTSSENRLRWRPKLGIEAVAGEMDGDEPEGSNSPMNGKLRRQFRFSQGQFGLPVWLSTQQQQVRIDVDAELRMGRRMATVSMSIQGNRSSVDPSNLLVNLGDWHLLDLRDGEQPASDDDASDDSASKIEISQSDSILTWQLESVDGVYPSSYVLVAERPLAATNEGQSTPQVPPEFELLESLTLPRIETRDASTVLNRVKVDIAAAGQDRWMVDLSSSPNLQKETGRQSNAYRFVSPESPWKISGQFVKSPLRLSMSGRASWSKQGPQWLTHSSWSLSAETNLMGRLRLVMPNSLRGDKFAFTAMVNSESAIVRRVAAAGPDRGKLGVSTDPSEASESIWEIVSPLLQDGNHQIELFSRSDLSVGENVLSRSLGPKGPDNSANVQQSIDTFPQSESVSVPIHLPSPVADEIQWTSPFRLNVPSVLMDSGGESWRLSLGRDQAVAAQRLNDVSVDKLLAEQSYAWEFARIPDSVLRFQLEKITVQDRSVKIPRALIRSLVGSRSRHEHLLAVVQDGQEIRVGLPGSLTQMRIEVRLDGQIVRATREPSSLVVEVPDEGSERGGAQVPDSASADSFNGRSRILDVRLWADTSSNSWAMSSKPLMRLPIGSGLQYWQLVVPTDSHLFWASSQSGRAMRWVQDRLRMSRQPVMLDDDLVEWVVGRNPDRLRQSLENPSFAVPGNRYLFFASDTFSFAAMVVSRTLLWLVIGGLVLVLSIGFQWFSFLNQPWVAIVAAVGLTGVLIVAPDGVVLTAQLVMLAFCLVAVFFAVSILTGSASSQRALRSRRIARPTRGASSQRFEPAYEPQPARLSPQKQELSKDREPAPSGDDQVSAKKQMPASTMTAEGFVENEDRGNASVPPDLPQLDRQNEAIIPMPSLDDASAVISGSRGDAVRGDGSDHRSSEVQT